MKNKLIDDINHYIEYLNSLGFYVSVHGKGISGMIEANIHSNPFCSFVKTEKEIWQKCIKCQSKVFSEYKREAFFGMCHAGIEEYVFYVNDKIFVSVSGYGINKDKAIERINRLSKEFYFNKKELLKIYDSGLKHEKEDFAKLHTLIKPLCHMLNLLELRLAEIPFEESKSRIFNSILAFVQSNYLNEITLSDIAAACACSESTVSHLFKKHFGKSAKYYINELRLNQSKKLLETSDLPISQVALLSGFSNINYFPTAFKKTFGLNPSDYRNQNYK